MLEQGDECVQHAGRQLDSITQLTVRRSGFDHPQRDLQGLPIGFAHGHRQVWLTRPSDDLETAADGAGGTDSGPSPWTAWYSAWLSLNIHLHMLFVDGVYTFEQERPRFHRGAAPTQPELQRLLRIIATRVTRALEGQGLLIRDDETPSLDLEPDDGFERLLGAAVHYRIATGPPTPGARP